MAEPESRPTVTASPEELARALAIWIKSAPKRIRMDYWHHAETVGKWGSGSDPLNAFDPRVAMAAYLAGKFEQAGWRAVYDQPVAPIEGELRSALKAQPSRPKD